MSSSSVARTGGKDEDLVRNVSSIIQSGKVGLCRVCTAYYPWYVLLRVANWKIVNLTNSQMTFGRITKLQLTYSYISIDKAML